ncbi:MAG: presqualene diphosphate synthase HpnD [Methylophilaceae bacterium]|nr:presqualene diphosphate synthase HpnD [Methylophilaceae bacterium]
MSPQEYCKSKAAASGSSFYYSFKFLSPAKREAITALYAFCREVDDIVDECTDVNVARTTLQWWRGEIENLYAGKPQHPVTQALVPAVRDYALNEEYFQEIINGMEMDLDQNRYPDFKQLQLYCYRVASVVGLLSASIFGYSNRATLKYAIDLGLAFQLTNITRDVGEDARRDRIYLPLDELAQFGVTEEDIIQGRESERVQKLLDFQIERAERFYDRAFSALPDEDRKPQLTGLVMAAIYRTLLREIKADGAQKVLNARVSLTPLHKIWLAWTAWLKA